MIVVLNGPLGIGKSTLAEALSESIDRCVMLDGDKIAATNPPSSLEYLHATLELLVAHHRRSAIATSSSITSGLRRTSSSICVVAWPTSTTTFVVSY